MSHQSDLIATDIEAYLNQHENKELLRLLTCGSVDDGKSTLIGRLLHDSKMIYEDQLAALHKDNAKVGNAGEALDLALLVDGLQAEREQGITIDVAYRYFSTARRKFIIADTPGHEQYTRNMATGASTCELAIILIDARHGVQVQTRRHSFIVSLLGIKHVLVAVNKMDLVEFSEARFNEIQQDYLEFAKDLNLGDVQFVPISALNGDNVVDESAHTPWYTGQPLMQILETVEIANDRNFDTFRFPVQYVNRPNLDFRGYCGTVASGVVKPGDEVQVLPSGKSSRVKSIVTYEGELEEAFPPMSVTLTLEDEIDISRGDLLVHKGADVVLGRRLNAMLVWMAEKPMVSGRRYEVKMSTATHAGLISAIHHKVDVNTMEQQPAQVLNLNEIASVELTLETPVVVDAYQEHRATGSFIVIDRLTNATVAAGMVQGAVELSSADDLNLSGQSAVSAQDLALRLAQSPWALQLSGGDAETRAQLLYGLQKYLFDNGSVAQVLLRAELPAELALQSGAVLDLAARGGLIALTDLEGQPSLVAELVSVAVNEQPVAEQLQQVIGELAQRGWL